MCSVPIPFPTSALASTPAMATTAPSATEAVADFSLTFPPEPHWVRSARDVMRTALEPLFPSDHELIETATLLTSEAVTNAVVASLGGAAPTPVALHAEWNGAGAVRVLVRDMAPGDPLIPVRTPDPEDEHGRGLLLISLLATEWGICRHVPGPGKVVWFTLGEE
jgi:anti-sigma regulatory factor (Ser/Thr protein kinase)